MSNLVRICNRAELPTPGQAIEIEAAGLTLCVANVDGEICAVDNFCPHHGGPLGQGVVEEQKIVCPWHAWEFNLRTGISTHSPDAKVAAYPLKIEGDDVLIEIQPA